MTRWLWLVLALTACDGGSTDDTGDETVEPFAPSSGSWDASPLTEDTDGCDIIDEDSMEAYALTLAVTDAQTFTLSGADIDLTCTLDGQQFTCDEEINVQDYAGEGVDVVLTTRFSYAGSFSSETSGALRYAVDVSCEGEDCPLLEKEFMLDLPCTSGASTTLTFAE